MTTPSTTVENSAHDPAQTDQANAEERKGFGSFSIRTKLILIALVPCSISMLAAFLIVFVSEIENASIRSTDRLERLAQLIGENSAAALEFDDDRMASQILKSLGGLASIDCAYLYDHREVLFSTYATAGVDCDRGNAGPQNLQPTGVVEKPFGLAVRAIVMGSEREVGSVVIHQNLTEQVATRERFFITTVVASSFALLMTFCAVLVFQGRITGPIKNLASTAEELVRLDDYGLRVPVESNDELGSMSESFNLMVAKVERFRNHLEGEVESRTAELVIERDRAEAADQAKTQFLANMSHEIRTPLNGILGLAESLEATEENPSRKQDLTTILGSGATLLQILNDILIYSKIEAGAIELEQVAIDPSEIAEQVARLFDQVAKAKMIDLVLELPPSDERRLVAGDPVRIRQILSNLLDNAIKFTESGSVHIRVRLDSIDENHSRLEFGVEDTGIGMAPEVLDRVFDRFSQADLSTTRQFGGTGLGLTIVRGLVDLMDGKLRCESTPGAGSRFVISIPVRNEDARETSERGIDLDRLVEQIEGLRLLVVDDVAVNRMVVRRLLERLNCHVQVVENGREAVDLVKQTSFDAVLMDCMMPVMSGYEAAAAIRDMPGSAKRIPIIALTANIMPEDHQKCIAAGMDDVVTKPINQVELLSAIVNSIAKRESDDSKENGSAGAEE